jgi:hypothetical protein
MTKIKLGNNDIVLDPELLKFNEHTLNKFLQDFASNYKIYNEYHANAQYIHSKYEDKYESLYSEKFKSYRENVTSDKMADVHCKCDNDIKEALEFVRISKRNVNMIWGFLRSMDRAHDDAIQFSYNIRKELEKIFNNVKTYEMI